MSKFGVQPGRRVVREMMFHKEWTYGDLAAAIGEPVTRNHLVNCFCGQARPMPEVREMLPRLVGRPIEDLFTDEVLSKPYNPAANPWAGVER